MMDVAARAGVSQATVSLILNGSPGVRFSEATRQKVVEAANELGYALIRRPTSRTPTHGKVIAFVVDELTSDPWMSMAFEGARLKAAEYGLTLMLAVTGEESEFVTETLALMAGKPLLGYIYGTILTRRIVPPPPLLQVPSVLVNCYDSSRRLPSVLPGDLVGGRAATEHLIRRGCRRIAMINGQEGLDASRDRLRGYRQALSSHDLPFDADLVRPGNWEPSAGYVGTMSMLELDTPPDAIFCANDMMAMGCYEALREKGLRIPDDVAVIGFDDREIAQFMRPALTTMVLPMQEMGAVAAEVLIDRSAGIDGGHNQLKVECTLVARQSA
jgi:LacI family transcriptional regulator